MEQKGSLLSWKLSLAETISFGVTLTVFVYFITTNFQSKEDGYKLEKRIDRLENEISTIKNGVNSIAVDTSYIKGVLTVRINEKNSKE
jgi:uncharacterized protein YpmS